MKRESEMGYRPASKELENERILELATRLSKSASGDEEKLANMLARPKWITDSRQGRPGLKRGFYKWL
jgi:hypothetical protein